MQPTWLTIDWHRATNKALIFSLCLRGRCSVCAERSRPWQRVHRWRRCASCATAGSTVSTTAACSMLSIVVIYPLGLHVQCKQCNLQIAESPILTCSLCQQYHSGPFAHILGWPWGKVCTYAIRPSLHQSCIVADGTCTIGWRPKRVTLPYCLIMQVKMCS
jgi:hypothetical protein